MKGIYSTFILIAIISIFSLQTSAQNDSGSNDRASVSASNLSNGHVISSRNFERNKANDSSASMMIESATGTAKSLRKSSRIDASTADHEQINYLFGVPVQRSGEIDRYGYQGSPLSNGTRPCLVAGARRCVQ